MLVKKKKKGQFWKRSWWKKATRKQDANIKPVELIAALPRSILKKKTPTVRVSISIRLEARPLQQREAANWTLLYSHDWVICARVITASEPDSNWVCGKKKKEKRERKAAIKLISPPARQSKPLIIPERNEGGKKKKKNRETCWTRQLATGHGSRSGRGSYD